MLETSVYDAVKFDVDDEEDDFDLPASPPKPPLGESLRPWDMFGGHGLVWSGGCYIREYTHIHSHRHTELMSPQGSRKHPRAHSRAHKMVYYQVNYPLECQLNF